MSATYLTTSTATLVRPLDAVERHFCRHGDRNPNHFVVAAEFDEAFTVDQLRPALAAVQRRHPFLSVHIEDRAASRLGFYRMSSVAPIELAVHQSPKFSWTSAAALELARPFDRSRAPLMRASLLRRSGSSVLLLTFDHTIADGLSAVLVLDDLVAALNGRELSQLAAPKSSEWLINSTPVRSESLEVNPFPEDPRMHRSTSVRAFDGAVTAVHALEMTSFESDALTQRCRTEASTVHAAILVSASRARAAERGEEFIRAFSLVNIRPLFGGEFDCALRLAATTTGLIPHDGASLWEQAREMTAQLKLARSEGGVAAAMRDMKNAIPVDADGSHSEGLILHARPFEILISNVGVQSISDSGPLRPTAVWGPMVQQQVQGEAIVGVLTYQGRLRMVACGYDVPSTFLHRVRSALLSAVDAA